MDTKFLISHPMLEDESFERSIVRILEYNTNECFGLMINKRMPYTIADLSVGIDRNDLPLYYGGPVDTDRLFFLHRTSELTGAHSAHGDLYWNGNFEELKEMLELGLIIPDEIRFYLGYSGWGAGQLQDEIAEGSWIQAELDTDFVFSALTGNELWRQSLLSLGGPYADMSLLPLDPQLN